MRIRIHLYGQDIEVAEEALLDTGYTGELVVPRSLAIRRPQPRGRVRVRLTDGSATWMPTYYASVAIGSFDPTSVTAIALGTEAILGVGVMDRFSITLDHAARLIVEE